jgi:hypothetical protein
MNFLRHAIAAFDRTPRRLPTPPTPWTPASFSAGELIQGYQHHTIFLFSPSISWFYLFSIYLRARRWRDEVEWARGKVDQRKLFFEDCHEFQHRDWSHCSPEDRRSYCEVIHGLYQVENQQSWRFAKSCCATRRLSRHLFFD